MNRRFVATMLTGVLLFAVSAAAQTAAEQLQKGIYEQESAGDLDAAIQIYRQILSSNPSDRKLAAQAQFRLFQALLQKGDFNGAQQELQNLSINFQEYRELIASMAGRTGGGAYRPNLTLGTLQNDRYHNKRTGVEFNTPAPNDGNLGSWMFQSDAPSSDNGEMAIFVNGKPEGFAAVWMKPDESSAASIPARLQHDMDRKHEDRAGMKGWTLRPGARTRLVGGQQALTAIADFTQGDEQMVEYLTWVRSTKTRALFFGNARAEDLGVLQSALEYMLGTAMVP